jgi:hypothetical protein
MLAFHQPARNVSLLSRVPRFWCSSDIRLGKSRPSSSPSSGQVELRLFNFDDWTAAEHRSLSGASLRATRTLLGRWSARWCDIEVL